MHTVTLKLSTSQLERLAQLVAMALDQEEDLNETEDLEDTNVQLAVACQAADIPGYN